MIAAFIYFKLQQDKVDLQKSRIFNILWNLVWPIFIILLSGSWVCSTFAFERPTIFTAICAALYKNLWGILLTIVLLGYNSRMGGHVKAYLDSSLNQLFGKANYGFYLTHMTVLKLMVGNFHQPYFFSFPNLVFLVINVTLTSYLVGSIVHIMIELPAANLQKIWNTRQNVPEKRPTIEASSSNNNNNNNVKSE